MRTIVLPLALAVLLGGGRAGAAEGDEDRAAELFDKGAAAYKEGHFDRAIELLEEAHRLVGEPILLYNLAKAYEGKGDFETAIDLYERYLAEASEIQDRGAIERRIATLRKSLEDNRALEADARAAEDRAARAEAAREDSPSPVPWIIAGAGGAGLAAGLILGAVAGSREDDANAEPVQLKAFDTSEDAETFATAANVCFAVGGALAVGGVTWGLIDLWSSSDGGSTETSRARLQLEPSSVRLVVILE